MRRGPSRRIGARHATMRPSAKEHEADQRRRPVTGVPTSTFWLHTAAVPGSGTWALSPLNPKALHQTLTRASDAPVCERIVRGHARTFALASRLLPAHSEAVRSRCMRSVATIYRLGWRFSGPTSLVLGALAALAHASAALGWRRAVALLLIGSTLSLSSELLGTSTGLPFGKYSYSGLLGYHIAGLVPFPIPMSWSLMIYASLAMCGRILPARDDSATRWRWALVGGAILTRGTSPWIPRCRR